MKNQSFLTKMQPAGKYKSQDRKARRQYLLSKDTKLRIMNEKFNKIEIVWGGKGVELVGLNWIS